MRRIARAAAMAVAVVVMLAVTGCAPSRTTVDATDTSAVVPAGGQLVVELGEVNSSVGTEWVLVTPPDPAVLGGEDVKIDSGQADPPPGASAEMTVTFTAVAAGDTTLVYEYRFRGEVPADPSEQKTLTFEITVH